MGTRAQKERTPSQWPSGWTRPCKALLPRHGAGEQVRPPLSFQRGTGLSPQPASHSSPPRLRGAYGHASVERQRRRWWRCPRPMMAATVTPATTLGRRRVLRPAVGKWEGPFPHRSCAVPRHMDSLGMGSGVELVVWQRVTVRGRVLAETRSLSMIVFGKNVGHEHEARMDRTPLLGRVTLKKGRPGCEMVAFRSQRGPATADAWRHRPVSSGARLEDCAGPRPARSHADPMRRVHTLPRVVPFSCPSLSTCRHAPARQPRPVAR